MTLDSLLRKLFLNLPGKLLKNSEISPKIFLRRVEQAVMGFSGPPRHHLVPQPQPQPLPRALLDAEFVYVCDDALKPPLSPLYSGPYRVLRRSEKFLFS